MCRKVVVAISAVISIFLVCYLGVVGNYYFDLCHNFDIKYNDIKVNLPVGLSVLEEDGWYVADVMPDCALCLKNYKYSDAIAYLCCENFSGNGLEDINSPIESVEFRVNLSGNLYPKVCVGGLSFGESEDAVLGKLGNPVADEALYKDGVPYHHYYFSKQVNRVFSIYYEVVLENGLVSGIKVSISRNYFG